MKQVTDFSDATLSISWENWHKLSKEVQEKIRAYAFDSKEVGETLVFQVAAYRLAELGIQLDKARHTIHYEFCGSGKHHPVCLEAGGYDED